jgi:hypothetical protein
MPTQLKKYTRQGFCDTAERRNAEARLLLEPKSWLAATGKDPSKRLWHCDGAVTCSLLAAECALKATLLHGKCANSVAELPAELVAALFETSHGHSVRRLWDHQESRIKAQDVRGLIFVAIDRLNGLDRYMHRYGAQRPNPDVAKPFVDLSGEVVRWMREVLK